MSTCRKDQILRKAHKRTAYYRADGTYVSAAKVGPTCIKDLGNSGRGPNLIPKMRKGELTKFGYSLEKLAGARRLALKKAVRAYDGLSVFRKLNALATLNKNVNPVYSRKFKADAAWVKKTYY